MPRLILISFLSVFLSTQVFAASPKAASEKTSESSRALSRRTSSSPRKVLAQKARGAVFEAKASNVETYDQLIKAIRQAQAASGQRMQQEKVRLAWETGKLINEYILKNKERADYDKQVILRLAKDLGSSERELYYMLEFARSYPILPTSAELTWSDYRALLDLNDPKQREELAARAKEGKWDVDRIRQEIKRINASKRGEKLPSETLESKPGKVGVYRVIKATVGPYAGQLALDLGFSNYYQPGELKEFKQGDIVHAEKIKEGFSLSGSTATFDDLYTYPAYVINVIDGDTFTAIIDLGFEFVTEQKLRLRGLDAPEIDSEEGKAAKEFVESSLSTTKMADPSSGGRGSKSGKAEAISAPILIKTIKSDKYDRYLADVFYISNGKQKYLNNELLEQKLAVRVE